MGAGGYESLACLVVLELLEVVDEHVGELVGLGVPFLRICVGVAGIEDLGIYAGELGGNSESCNDPGIPSSGDGGISGIYGTASGVFRETSR